VVLDLRGAGCPDEDAPAAGVPRVDRDRRAARRSPRRHRCDRGGAGLLPIAAGYLVAHYFTYLLIDGQRIIVAIADPLQQGWDLGGFGWAFFEPTSAFLPPGLVWTVQIAAVVGGHMLGAWAGHVTFTAEHGHAPVARRREVPLAVIMVALTTLTLWSLGQTLVVEVDGDQAAVPVASVPAVVLRR
jgi:hypothetical protein